MPVCSEVHSLNLSHLAESDESFGLHFLDARCLLSRWLRMHYGSSSCIIDDKDVSSPSSLLRVCSETRLTCLLVCKSPLFPLPLPLHISGDPVLSSFPLTKPLLFAIVCVPHSLFLWVLHSRYYDSFPLSSENYYWMQSNHLGCSS